MFDVSKFRSNRRNYYCNTFGFIRALENILLTCLFSSTDRNFDRFLFPRILDTSMSAKHSKCVGAVEKDFLIEYSFRVLDIRWLLWSSKLEQNEKKIYISTFDHSSHPALAFQDLLASFNLFTREKK